MPDDVQVLTGIAAPSSNFTRPGDTNVYAAGDMVANNTAAASVVPLVWRVANAKANSAASFYVTGVRLRLDKSDVTSAQFRVHLYKALPTFTSSGDNGVFGTVVATGYADWVASFDVTIVAKHADGVAGVAVPTEGMICPQLVAGTPESPVVLYGLIEALAAYTPKSAGVITAELLVELN